MPTRERISSCSPLEGVAVRPYAEFVNVTKITSTKPAVQRDARWDVKREGRETKVLASDVSGASVYRRLRHEREAPTTRAK